jgi:hypothetical protein
MDWDNPKYVRIHKVPMRFEHAILFRAVSFFVCQGDFRNSIIVDLEIGVMFDSVIQN